MAGPPRQGGGKAGETSDSSVETLIAAWAPRARARRGWGRRAGAAAQPWESVLAATQPAGITAASRGVGAESDVLVGCSKERIRSTRPHRQVNLAPIRSMARRRVEWQSALADRGPAIPNPAAPGPANARGRPRPRAYADRRHPARRRRLPRGIRSYPAGLQQLRPPAGWRTSCTPSAWTRSSTT